MGSLMFLWRGIRGIGFRMRFAFLFGVVCVVSERVERSSLLS